MYMSSLNIILLWWVQLASPIIIKFIDLMKLLFQMLQSVKLQIEACLPLLTMRKILVNRCKHWSKCITRQQVHVSCIWNEEVFKWPKYWWGMQRPENLQTKFGQNYNFVHILGNHLNFQTHATSLGLTKMFIMHPFHLTLFILCNYRNFGSSFLISHTVLSASFKFL